MSESPPEEVAHWMGKARSDRLNVENNPAAAEVPWDTVCFHCQQAAEKLLKAVLVMKGESIPRTHDLLDLARRCGLSIPSVSSPSFRQALELLNPYAVAPRYEDPRFSEGEDEGREAYEALLRVWDALVPVLRA
jgi:HEPN domain-containing protein